MVSVSTTAHLEGCTERQSNTNPVLSHPISLAKPQQEIAQIRVGALWDCEKQQGRREEKRSRRVMKQDRGVVGDILK